MNDTAGCLGKIAYASRAAAAKAQRSLIRKPGWGTVVHAYHCDRCGAFHLGRDKRTGRRERIAEDPTIRLARYLELTVRSQTDG